MQKTRAPKRIKVNGHHIHFRFAQQLLWSLILGTLAVASVAAVYYLLFETRYEIAGHTIVYLKGWWDGLFSQSWWTVVRHGLRDILEGVLAKFLIQTLVAKWQKHADQRLTDAQIFARGIILLIVAVALTLLGIYLLNFAGPNAWHHLFQHHKVTDSVKLHGEISVFLSQYNWPDLITGFIVGHILRGYWRPIGATISLNFIEKSVTRARSTGRTPLWVKYPLMPPTVRERFAWIMQEDIPVEAHGPWPGRIATASAAVLLMLAGYGEYVLQVIAKGK